jgi:hypothetical protein
MVAVASGAWTDPRMAEERALLQALRYEYGFYDRERLRRLDDPKLADKRWLAENAQVDEHGVSVPKRGVLRVRRYRGTAMDFGYGRRPLFDDAQL